jgi:hypothetical protein
VLFGGHSGPQHVHTVLARVPIRAPIQVVPRGSDPTPTQPPFNAPHDRVR